MSDRSGDTLVVNFNAPELDQLARHLAASQRLGCYVRPYANKDRAWERWLAASPAIGRLYSNTIGRRRLGDARLSELTLEAGVAADWCQAAVGRLRVLPVGLRHFAAQGLHKNVRRAVATQAARRASGFGCIVAYEGFALPAFEASRQRGDALRVLNYPVAHHRHRRRVRDEEIEREPAFAATWPGFDDWPHGHEERLDAEIASAHSILVGSEYVADTFAQQGVERERIAVVPYGVDLGVFTPAAGPRARDGRFRIIYSGQLTQRKGLSYLLRGYARFRRPDSDLTLVGMPVGDPGALVPYGDLFEHVPHQPRSALAQRYRDSDVFVLPTLIEGMPLVVVEAMACGLPVIVTANGPAGIVRDGIDGFIVPERDEEAVADRLERLHRDPELRQAMGASAAARAREFSWQAYADRALAHLDALRGRAPQA
jgi:glycosyltransferase involved in cell wall biosynthesis